MHLHPSFGSPLDQAGAIVGLDRPMLGCAVLRDQIAEDIRCFYQDHHDSAESARRRHRYYYRYLARVLRARLPEAQTVLEIGCGSGHLLASLNPTRGVGIDLAAKAIAAARSTYCDSKLEFIEGDGSDPEILARAGGPFDAVVLVNVVAQLSDVQATLQALHPLCHRRTRVFIYSYSRLWQPLLHLAEGLGLKHPSPPESWLPPEEVANMLALADFEVVRRDAHMLFPAFFPVVSEFFNRYLGRLPVLNWFSLMYGIVARPAPQATTGEGVPPPTVSVIVPSRNEAGHIRPLVSRLPRLVSGSEFIFVEGNSTDDTEATIVATIAENPHLPLRFLKQTGKGKGDAVRLGFAEAKGDVLLILDSDIGVAPEDVPKFVDALTRGKGEFINGSRMVYPMEGKAMRFLNLLANKFFAWLFGWLLGQQVRDTLCGTKALRREDYQRIARHRSYFGDFDPFGDFDLLFGASRLNLRIVDVAVRYHERQYGSTNISRFRHGWLLLRMSAFAARKLKFI